MLKIHIEYCIMWNYKPEFDRVSKIINQINSDIIVVCNKTQPRTGAFEVTKDGINIYSKFETDEFPNESTIKGWFK